MERFLLSYLTFSYFCEWALHVKPYVAWDTLKTIITLSRDPKFESLPVSKKGFQTFQKQLLEEHDCPKVERMEMRYFNEKTKEEEVHSLGIGVFALTVAIVRIAPWLQFKFKDPFFAEMVQRASHRQQDSIQELSDGDLFHLNPIQGKHISFINK